MSCVITSHNPSQRGEWRGRATGRQTERLKADAARLRLSLSLSLVFLLSVFLSRPFASLSLSPRHNHTHLIVTLSRLNTSFHSHNPQVLLKHTLLFRVCVRGRESDIISTEGCGRLNEFSHFGSFFRSRLDFILVSFCLFASCELPLFPPRPQPLFPFRPFVFSLYNLVPLPFFLPSSSLVFWYLFTSWCNFPPSFHPSPKFLPSPFSLSHPPPLLTFLPYFLSPLHVSVVLPFYFHFLLNSISLGSSFLPSSFFPVSSLTPAFPSYFLPSFYCSSHFNLFCLSFLLSILFLLYFLVFILLPLLLCLPVLPISLLSFLPYILRPSCSPLFILLCPVLSPSSIFFAVLHFGFSLLPRTLHISTISSISSPLCSLYSVSGFFTFFLHQCFFTLFSS